MQTLVQVICNGTQWQSLRKIITNDTKLEDYELYVTRYKKKGRSGGWAKIYSPKAYGVLNVEWDGRTKILSARAVTRNTHKYQDIISLYVDYLLARHKNKIKIINILPAK